MRPSFPSTFVSVVGLLLIRPTVAHAQACCAGSGAVTPARLGTHEDALIGLQLRSAFHLGSHDAAGAFVPTPSHAREVDLEQNLFGAVRVLRRVQLAGLVPLVETHRRAGGRSSTGGGLGDLNLAARWDPLLAGESRLVPGLGLLGGVTFPTGRTAEDARKPMATDATGIGAVQATAGLSLEQAFGPWFVSLSALLAYRAPRTVGSARMALAPQLTALAAVGYALDSGATVAVVGAWTAEANARINGIEVPESARRVVSASVAFAYPFSDAIRAIGSVFANPPLAGLGLNQPVTAGLTLGLLWGFS